MQKIKPMKQIIILILIILTSLAYSNAQMAVQDYGTIKVLYLHRLNKQLLNPLQETRDWKLKTFLRACLSDKEGELRDSLNKYYTTQKLIFSIGSLAGLKPDNTKKCTRYYEGMGRKHDSKIYADKDNVYVTIERRKKKLAFIIKSENYYIIQYREGYSAELIFELIIGDDYIIALFHKDQKVFWAGNNKKIQADKAWKLYNPKGMYPFDIADLGYFKVQVRVQFD